MKKLFALAMICLTIQISANAQKTVFNGISAANKTLIDTVSTSNTVRTQIFKVTQNATAVTMQVFVSKLTGTAAGVVRAFGSLNGIDFYRLNATDSLNISNTPGVGVIQTRTFIVPHNYLYYALTAVGTGTQTTRMTSKIQTFK